MWPAPDVLNALVIDGDHQYFGFVQVRRAEQIQAGRVSVIDHVSEPAQKVDVRGCGIERGKANLAHAQNAAHDLSDPSEAGNDDGIFMIGDGVKIAPLLLAKPATQNPFIEQEAQRSEDHRDSDRNHQKVGAMLTQDLGRAGDSEQYERKLSALGKGRCNTASRVARLSKQAADSVEDQGLGDHKSDDHSDDTQSLIADDSQVGRHSHCHEKQTE